jgi:hypothetical protein
VLLLLVGPVSAQSTSHQASDLGGPLTRPDPAALQTSTPLKLEIQAPDPRPQGADRSRPTPRAAEDPTGASRIYGTPNASSTVFQNGFNRINIRW